MLLDAIAVACGGVPHFQGNRMDVYKNGELVASAALAEDGSSVTVSVVPAGAVFAALRYLNQPVHYSGERLT